MKLLPSLIYHRSRTLRPTHPCPTPDKYCTWCTHGALRANGTHGGRDV